MSVAEGGAAVLAVGAVSAFGRGVAATPIGAVGEASPVAITADETFRAAGLEGALSARALPDTPAADPAVTLLVDAMEQLVEELDERETGWRQRRIGLCLGTSSGAMVTASRAFEARRRDDGAAIGEATYFSPVDEALSQLALPLVRRSQVVAACASSTIAMGRGLRWLEQDLCDLVIAGGYDALSLFVAAGFAALRATTVTAPRPFRAARDGMVLGEAAAVVALAPARCGARWYLTGFGASADAVHITAPDREGGGLRRSARAALADAGCAAERVDLVSAHGTATPYNDAAEAGAIRVLFEPRRPWVHPYKAQIGHCLGAAGVVETLAMARGLTDGRVPATAGDGDLDPDAHVRLAATTEEQPLDAGLKLSAAFGGVTAALVVEREPAARRPPRSKRRVKVLAGVSIDDVDREALAVAVGVARDRLARIDDLGQLGVAAVAALREALPDGALAGAGVVAGHALATIDTNERFYRRLLDKGARRVDPRLFPATSPNAGAGHVSIFFGLTGPCFAVHDGLDGSLEALEAAAELVAMGDAERMVVLAADDAGPMARAWLDQRRRPTVRRGATALLLGAADDPLAAEGAKALPEDLRLREGDSPGEPGAEHVGHAALAPFVP